MVERMQAGEVSKTTCILWCPSAEQYVLVGEERWRNCLIQVVEVANLFLCILDQFRL